MRVRFSLLVVSTAGVAAAASLPVTGLHKVEHTVWQNFQSRPGRTVAVKAFYPADRARGPFPLLLFSPGYGAKPSQYSSQLEDLVSHGYVVAGLEHSADDLDSFEARAALWAQDIVAAKQEVLSSSIREIIDGHKIGAFGHSLGGRAAAGACLLDATILACLNEDGSNDDVQLKRPYWPIEGRDFAGAFAMVDWFDPGISDEDLRAMGKTREQYAASRLEPPPSALSAYRAARRGAIRITMLTPGMQHTAFTDDLWANASSDNQRARYADYLSTVRVITLQFFDLALHASSVCDVVVKEAYTQCFKPTGR
ncbi:MAG: hypothetical protein JST11_09725 [Acidobacteria bacterium]|nr:hypothetical protein [Acidobacteriota bacterium]